MRPVTLMSGDSDSCQECEAIMIEDLAAFSAIHVCVAP